MKSKKKLIRRARAGATIKQVAALPMRVSDDGRLEVLLLTSRSTGRFVLPKGWPEKGLKDHKAAAREASEEAGVAGKLGTEPIGSFQYWKRLDNAFVPIQVRVYPLVVETVLEMWKEMDQRSRAWLTPNDAAVLVDEPELVSLLNALAVIKLNYDS